MSPAATLVSSVEIKVGGQPLDPSVMERLLEARVQDNLMLPDAFLLRLRDPNFELVEGTLFDVGARVELRFAGTGPGPAGEPFAGEVTTLAPQFESEGCVLAVRGYDASHTLNRSRQTRTFQDMTASDIATTIIRAAGLPADVAPTNDVYAFEQQSNETDWHYLWRLAVRVGYELTFSDGKVHFRAPGKDAGAAVKVTWGDDLRAFHPRATAVGQVDEVTVSGWDPKAKRRVAATKRDARLDSTIGLARSKVAGDGGGGAYHVTDQIVSTQAEADALAQSTLDRVANTWLEAEGVCRGNPSIRAGTKISVAGIGTRFGGEYLVTKSTHVMRGTKGYETQFEISGRSRRTLLDILTPTRQPDYTGALVIGVVTNNDDPEKMGRVRVKFPGLDDAKEGWWARVASLSATGDRGVLMMPLVDDEVVVGFEHGDPRRPFVLGALWNGPGRPGPLAAQGSGPPDGSFTLRSKKKISMHAVEAIDVATDKTMQTGVKSDYDLKVDGALRITGNGSEIAIKGPSGSIVIRNDGSIAIKGAQISIDASAQLKLSSPSISLKGANISLG